MCPEDLRVTLIQPDIKCEDWPMDTLSINMLRSSFSGMEQMHRRL